MRLVTFAPRLGLLFSIGASLALAQPAPPGNDIASFVACLDDRLINPATVNVADTVQCIPNGCKLTVTMSQESAQPACFEQPQPTDTKVQLPRIILSCPGPAGSEWQRFRPSYLLCPVDIPKRNNGWNRIEVGQDLQPSVVNNLSTINMQMSDILIPFNQKWVKIVNPAATFSNNCATCHIKTPPGADPTKVQPIDNFGTFKSKQLDNINKIVTLRSYVVGTTEPTKGPLVNTPPAPGTTPTTLAAVCGIQARKIDSKEFVGLFTKLSLIST